MVDGFWGAGVVTLDRQSAARPGDVLVARGSRAGCVPIACLLRAGRARVACPWLGPVSTCWVELLLGNGCRRFVGACVRRHIDVEPVGRLMDGVWCRPEGVRCERSGAA